MSRLAHLLTQLSSTSQTQEKLAATYFDPPSFARPPSPVPPPRPLPSMTWLVLVALAGVALGAVVSAELFHSNASAPAPLSTVYPVLTFDEPDAWEQLGQRFGLWWGMPGDPAQALNVTLDPNVHAGSAGRSLRVDYILNAISPSTPSSSASPGAWFELPMASRAIPGHLELMVRADTESGHAQLATLELRNRALTEQHHIIITPEWTTISVPLGIRVDPSGQALFWREFRILLGRGEGTGSTRGHLYIDQIRLTTAQR